MKDFTTGFDGDCYDEDPFDNDFDDEEGDFESEWSGDGPELSLDEILRMTGGSAPCSLPRRMLLGEDCSISLDSKVSGLNSNVLVLGPSGSGKTRGFIEPNLYLHEENVVVLDVKGRLHERLAEGYRRDGYEVHLYDLEHLDRSVSYNPLLSALNKGDRSTDIEQLWRLAAAFFPITVVSDPFWEQQARVFFVCAVERLLRRYRSYEEVPTLSDIPNEIYRLVEEFKDAERSREVRRRRRAQGPSQPTPVEGGCGSGANAGANPDLPQAIDVDLDSLDDILMGFASQDDEPDTVDEMTPYEQAVVSVYNSEKTFASIMSFLYNGLAPLLGEDVERSFSPIGWTGFFRPESLADGRHACFVRVSDIDHTRAALASVFFSHCIQTLFRLADEAPNGSLPRPVRFVLDDFANLHIDGIEDILSTCRSRNIAVTLCLQSVSQLNALYGSPTTNSIVSNCDIQLVLGFADLATAAYFSPRANKEPTELYETPRGLSWLFLRGERGRTVRALDTGATQVVDVAEAMAHDWGTAA